MNVDRYLVAVVAAFALSRVGYLLAGVEFDATPLDGYWQFIDPPLLRERLLESLWHAHAQPPFFNLVAGVVLKLFGAAADTAFQLLFLGLGLALAVLLYRLMRRLGAGAVPSALLAAVYAAGPAAVLYENWLYVEQLVAVCLLGGAVLLHRFVERGRTRDALGCFALLAVVALSRPIFHLVWLVALVALVWLARADRRRAVLAAAAIPLALTAGVYVKNLVMFDTVSSTSCSGINAARVTTMQLPRAELRRLVADGTLSRYALYSPFELPTTAPEVFAREPRRGVPLLDRPSKASGAANLDHSAYLDICRRYLDDAVTVLRERPGTFRRALGQAGFIYWRPTSQYAFFSERNRDRTATLERAYGLAFYGQIRAPDDVVALAFGPPRGDYGVGARIDEVAWFALLGYLAAIAFAAVLVRRGIAAREPAALAAVAAYVLVNVVWVTLVGTGFETGENNRFRYLTDPLVLALIAALATRAARRLRHRRSGPSRAPEAG